MNIQQNPHLAFEAMKPHQFKGFDYACVRKFKAPVEKFNTNRDLQIWAKDKFDSYRSKSSFRGRNYEATIRRKELIQEWIYKLEMLEILPTTILIIMTSILQGLKENNDKIPPIFSPSIFDKTINDISKRLEHNKDEQFNFKNTYCSNLKNRFINDSENFTGWIKIPSGLSDKENFDANLDKLKAFSNKTWCTTSFLADAMLKTHDFHIWLNNGKPKIALKFQNRNIQEIQGELNNGAIDYRLFEILKSYICENNFAMEEKALYTYYGAKNEADKINALKNKVREAIQENNPFKLLQNLGFEPQILENGTFSINEYREYDEHISLKEIGVEEGKLLENVSIIRGNAEFANCDIKSLKNIKQILGSADFCNSTITELGALESIGGNANFSYSNVLGLGNLKYIGGNCNINHSPISKLDKLEYIGKNLTIEKNVVEISPKLVIEGSTFITS